MKKIIIDNITYKIGQNAQDNTDMIKSSDSEWTWFHLDKFPSSHVIICKSEPSNQEISQAAQLVKDNSKYKFNNIGICYCKINNLITLDKPGTVTYKSNRQVKVINI